MPLRAALPGSAVNVFREKDDDWYLSPTNESKAPILRLADSGNGIPKKTLRGDRNQCPLCAEYFKSSKAFDQHKTGSIGVNRRCLTTAEMLARNFSKTVEGFWCSPVAQKDRERLNRIRHIKPIH